MELTTFLLIVSPIISLILFYLIISSATRSKQILKTSQAQLQVLIQMALQTGVDENRIRSSIDFYREIIIAGWQSEYNGGKITQAEIERRKSLL